MDLVKTTVFLHKVTIKEYSADTPLIPNTFIDELQKFEKLTLNDVKELISLANAAPEEKIFGLNLYAKLLELKQCGNISGDSICDHLYSSCVYQSGKITLQI